MATDDTRDHRTLDDYLDSWLGGVRARLQLGTFEDYDTMLRRFVRPELGDRPLASIEPLDVQAVVGAIVARGHCRTARYVYAVLHAALAQAVRWRMLEANPADGVELPRKARREMIALDPEQTVRLLDAFAGTRDHALVMLAVTTGLRPSEYLALRWSDVHDDTLVVQRALARGGGFKETKRASSRRSVRLVPTAAHALADQRAKVAHDREAAKAWVDGDLIFPDPFGRQDRPKALSHRFTRRARAVDGIPKVRLYDLRHTAATLALAAGVPVKVVSEQLGHASAAFTLDVYGHVLSTMQDVAADRVERLIFGVP